ncbi:hypothetical protein [Nibribacter koreensis]|uniref:Lipoprotein n=1 Tax=Nibribacter koreensis TaxID=1084519 RepID=A0ABP8FCK7_9BACT
MTLKAITKLALLLTLMVGSVACSSSRKTGSVTSRFPGGVNRDGSDRSTRYPDGFPIPLPGSTNSTKGMPPGQAKKVYGDKSAKAYAPGQQKKKHNGQGNGKGNSKGKKGKGKKH